MSRVVSLASQRLICLTFSFLTLIFLFQFQFLFQISYIQSGQACGGYDAGRTGPSAAQEKCWHASTYLRSLVSGSTGVLSISFGNKCISLQLYRYNRWSSISIPEKRLLPFLATATVAAMHHFQIAVVMQQHTAFSISSIFLSYKTNK